MWKRGSTIYITFLSFALYWNDIDQLTTSHYPTSTNLGIANKLFAIVMTLLTWFWLIFFLFKWHINFWFGHTELRLVVLAAISIKHCFSMLGLWYSASESTKRAYFIIKISGSIQDLEKNLLVKIPCGRPPQLLLETITTQQLLLLLLKTIHYDSYYCHCLRPSLRDWRKGQR